MDFAALVAGGAGALAALAGEIAAAWAAAVGVPTGQVQVELSAGSLVVDITVAFVGEDADTRVASTQASVTDLSLVASVVRESPTLGATIGVESREEVSADGMKALVKVSRNEKASNAEDAGGPSPGGSPSGDSGWSLPTVALAGMVAAPLILLAAALALAQRGRSRRRRLSHAQTMVGRRGQYVARESMWGGLSFSLDYFSTPTVGDGEFGGGEGVVTRQVALSVINPLARPTEPSSGSDSATYPPPIPEELRASLSDRMQPPPIPKALRGSSLRP